MANYEERVNAIIQRVKEMEAKEKDIDKESEEKIRIREQEKALIRGRFVNYILVELEEALRWNEKIHRLTITQTKKLKDNQEIKLIYEEDDYETIFQVEGYYYDFNNKEQKEKTELPPLILGIESYEELIQSFKKSDEEKNFNTYTMLGGFLKVECEKEKITVTPNYEKK